MEEKFTIEVEASGRDIFFECQLLTIGYIHKFQTSINGIEIILEPDEERKYRAIIPNDGATKLKDFERQAIRGLIDKLENIR